METNTLTKCYQYAEQTALQFIQTWREQEQFEGFWFSPGRNCEEPWIDPGWCIATEPKPWKKQEIQLIKAWLQEIENTCPHLITGIRNNGYIDLRRYGHGFRKCEDGHYEREEHGAWVWARDKSINFSDFIFLPSLPHYPDIGSDPGQLSLLHELVHAYNLPEPLWQEFLTLAGWGKIDNEWVLKNQNMVEIKTKLNEMRQLAIAGKFAEAMTLNREYGIRHGFPTLYSMTNPNDCLSEMAVFVHYDRRASSYMKPSLILWVQKNILN